MNMVLFNASLLYIREAIAAIGVIVITGAAVRSTYQLLMMMLYDAYSTNFIRLQFGNCVILGLEFMVGADLIGSLVAPDYYNLGMLAIIVIIRAVLSYFLDRELQRLMPKERKKMRS